VSQYDPKIPGLSVVDDVILFGLAVVSTVAIVGLAVWSVVELVVWVAGV
jgi:hypothetical protein